MESHLEYARTATAVHLARKAAIGILPHELRGLMIWPNTAA